MRPIDEIADRYVDDWAGLDPMGATTAGVAGHDDEVTDLSSDGYAARADLNRRTLAELATADPTDDRERAARDAMVERLSLDVELYEAGEDREMNVIASPVHGLRQVFDLMPLSGEEAGRNVAARLAGLPAALDQLRATLSADAATGRVAARRQLTACVDGFRDWTGRDDFFGGLVARIDGVPDSLRTELSAAAAGARDAVDAFGRYVTDELLPHAPVKDAAGLDRYRRASRYFLGATVDLAETYEWGWQELARIEADMRRTAGMIVPGGSVDDAVAALDADPKRRIAGKEAFRDWMQRLADETIAELAGTHFDIPEPVRRIEACIAPTTEGGIYYTPPTEDWSRPGRMWWAVPAGIEEFATWREVTTVYHEGAPGHHLQVGQTVYRKELLNRWQRLLCWVSGSGEGWALYAERLMDDLGYLSDPGARLGMLDAQSFRATRVIIDIGMHLELPIPRGTGFHEGEVWTPELGWEFLRAHCRMEEEFLRYELLRYLGWPGQAPSYKVGERIWLAARDDAKRRKGADFDLREFHRAALDLGSIGLDPLRAALARL
ncbi:DUF885 domain-containing protein [Actinocatenispora rupis]|uniref:DUF885 domain-containing protein n=1 Tax=Actinocatenispora rupis TaxID=519421 RepID=A0A8J3J9H6_9ACTN|nr:DUF885 domain-containing protein [Actinocatenispora rupis]GID14312.1 hypothetical protein Aru02nite_52010 [Actinocatenispora rupis]